jgi:phage gp29-like protein
MPIIGAVIAAATSRDFLASVAILTVGLCVEAAIPRYDYDTAAEPDMATAAQKYHRWVRMAVSCPTDWDHTHTLGRVTGLPLASSTLDARSGVPDRRFGGT